ncbi:MAG: hypothetical protein MUO35_05560 [Anaerolineales bacterium]|nr:hypothetical protein [Anaerolineales bacterium]
MTLAVDQTGLAQQPEMVRDSGLLYRQRRFEIAHADLASPPSQDAQKLKPHRVAEQLEELRELLGLGVVEDAGYAVGATAAAQRAIRYHAGRSVRTGERFHRDVIG